MATVGAWRGQHRRVAAGIDEWRQEDVLVRWIALSSLTLSLWIVSLLSCATVPPGRATIDFVGNIWPNGVGEGVTGSDLWTQVTPENAGKWESVEASRDEPDWGQLDAAYGYAKERGIPFRLHTLIWGQQYPSWMAEVTADEQREEIEEWISELADRYPEVDYIDVVNEPVHEVPVFADALGGAGESGYDWVIRSFELAREHFPDSALHINEYNILTDSSVIDDYLEVVGILQERGLVDGIGLQAHSLERSDLTLVRTKLDRLAETGLPIFITELDVSIRNDVLQAERFIELFSIFARHPAVRGITLWGSTEGRTWRRYGYLIRRDGSYRPSLEWLLSYLDGSDYEIPEYVPSPRVGTPVSLRLDAEDYDNQQGVEAAGSVIANVDGGDWVGFEQVQFRVEYTALKIRYAKGGGDPSVARLMLLSPNGYEAATIPLPETGGWNSFSEFETEWAALDGLYDVYLFLDGGEGAGNIDYIEFLQPGANALLGFVDDSREEEVQGGVQLQPEVADEIVGIEVVDDFIAYLDDSDYVAFRAVDFGAGVTKLLVKYAKASTTRAGVELRLDAMTNDPFFTFQLGATGGWNDFALVETALPEVTGVHDLYVTFRQEDTTGIGNFDWFWFLTE